MIKRELDIEHVILELGTTCNLKCYDCHHVLFPKEKFNIEFKDILTVIKRFKNIKEVILSGNYSEPTLYPDIIKLVKYLKMLHKKVYIYTNFEKRNDSFWKELVNILKDEDELVVSLFGVGDNHKKYRVNGDYQNILHNYDLLKDSVNIQLQFIKFDYNKDDFEELKDTFGENIIYLENNDIDEFFYDKFDNIVEPVDISCASYERDSVEVNEHGKVFPCHLARNYNIEIPITDGEMDYSSFFDGTHDFCKTYCNKNNAVNKQPW